MNIWEAAFSTVSRNDGDCSLFLGLPGERFGFGWVTGDTFFRQAVA
ncbi:hypothetical protein [Cohnella nanjingensis]|nr:hypothetical protein [Cohnella nanjingensis]